MLGELLELVIDFAAEFLLAPFLYGRRRGKSDGRKEDRKITNSRKEQLNRKAE